MIFINLGEQILSDLVAALIELYPDIKVLTSQSTRKLIIILLAL